MSNATKDFRVDKLGVQIYDSETELALSVSSIVQQYLQQILKQKQTVAVLFATGNSQLKFLDALTGLNNIDWSRVRCFHLDEYLGISAEHSSSFRYYLRERIEKRITPQKFNYIEGDTLQPLQECDRYSKLLTAQPIDLCMLGIGENGHLAFNEPSVADFNDPYMVKLVKLDSVNHQQQVKEGHFPNLESVPKYAFTLTIPMICAAKKIICLAPGKRKAEVVKQLLEGDIDVSFPASILRNQPQAQLSIDVDAASLIKS
ncbi:glucosamine-6-phosphate deaminase [Rivularia sp. UHCC 0363]|uniref:glucosamine-6-phosphate deaminase n=1 Tax=Rivularia sp. UHCC 0363 TaxID=3110244 RepID=UPI002B216AF7|nr:glucosamine-6-phosphate deaminase [Rivularia sp. UHCC 0363]MEA5596150.1 glucosamine-6-phosphate deaminase [Rivularia sp. UHCC 0363]